MNTAGIAALAACALMACATTTPPVSSRIVGALEARHRDDVSRASHGSANGPAAGVWAYRALVAPGLGSRCRMLPSDSEYLDRRARTCGAVRSTIDAVARLFLEVAATPEILPVTVLDGRLRYIDLPGSDQPAGESCRP